MSIESNEPGSASTPLVPSTAPSTPTEPGARVAPTVAVAAPVRKRGAVDWLLAGAAILAIVGVAFAIGRATAPSVVDGFAALPGGAVTVEPGGSFDPGSGGPVPGRAQLGAGGPTIDGTVTAIDADSVTIELANGEEMTLELDADTTYHEATEADASSVAVGDEVAVRMDGGRIQFGGPSSGQGGDGGTTSDGEDPGATSPSASDITVRR
jgi:Domain of unknown function (DUF5666)